MEQAKWALMTKSGMTPIRENVKKEMVSLLEEKLRDEPPNNGENPMTTAFISEFSIIRHELAIWKGTKTDLAVILVQKNNPESDAELKQLKARLGKTLFYHENKSIYFICKIYEGLMHISNRLIFFILLLVNSAEDSIVALLTLTAGAFIWYKWARNTQYQLYAINMLAITSITLKNFLSILDIPDSTESLDIQKYSLIRTVFPDANNAVYKFYLAFSQGRPNAQDAKTWLLIECLMFLGVQLYTFLYLIILMFNSSIIIKH